MLNQHTCISTNSSLVEYQAITLNTADVLLLDPYVFRHSHLHQNTNTFYHEDALVTVLLKMTVFVCLLPGQL